MQNILARIEGYFYAKIIGNVKASSTFTSRLLRCARSDGPRWTWDLVAFCDQIPSPDIFMSHSQGLDKERYKFVPRVLVFMTRGNEVLLIKRGADRAVFPNQYNGVGGHVEKGESVLAAARREVEEESGLKPKDLWLCAVVAIDTGDQDAGIMMWVFRGEADGKPKASNEGDIAWVPVARVQELDMVEDIPTLLPMVLRMKRGDKILWGFYRYEDGKLRMHFEE